MPAPTCRIPIDKGETPRYEADGFGMTQSSLCPLAVDTSKDKGHSIVMRNQSLNPGRCLTAIWRIHPDTSLPLSR